MVEPTATPAPDAGAAAEPDATRRGFSLGAVAVTLLIAEAATGLGLVFFYRPVTATAYFDLVDLEQVSGFGFVRALHHWGAHAVVILVCLHFLRVVLRDADPPSRPPDWWLGVALLVLTLTLAGTGYVLRWDAATTDWLSGFGMSTDADPRLLVVYGLHCAVLPVLTVWLVRDHLRRARRDRRV